MRKPVFRVSDQVQHKPGSATTEDGSKLKISDLGSREIVLSNSVYVEKTKALVICAVTTTL